MSSCYHCAQELASNANWQIEENDAIRAFCCPACMVVYQCIHTDGLAQYYVRRSEPAATPVDSFGSTDYRDYDDLLDALDFVNHEGNCYTANLLVSDLRCSACAWLLESVLTRLPGVQAVTISLYQKRLSISWCNDQLKLSDIMKCAGDYAYPTEPWTEFARNRAQTATREQLQRRLGVAGLLMMQVGMMSIALYAGNWQGMESGTQVLLRTASLLLTVVSLCYCAVPFLSGGIRAVRHLQPTMDVPISIALVTAFAYSAYGTAFDLAHVYFDTVCMFVFFLLLSRYVEARSRDVLRSSNASLLPAVAQRRVDRAGSSAATEYGSEYVLVSELHIGDQVLCKPGDVAASDGWLIEGDSAFDESAFSGESDPVRKTVGDRVLAGSCNLEQRVWYQVSCPAHSSSITQIDELAESVRDSKPVYMQLIDRVSPWFTACVLILASITFAVWWSSGLEVALLACLAVLIISCPCALALATPVALTAAQVRARGAGVIPMSSRFLSSLPKVTDVVFDKTGTLGETRLSVSVFAAVGLSNEDALQIAASLQQVASHPLAMSFVQANDSALLVIDEPRQHSGEGVSGELDGVLFRLGKPVWASQILPDSECATSQLAHTMLCSSSGVQVCFAVKEQLRDDAVQTCKALQANGYRLHLFSGDNEQKVKAAAQSLGIENAHFAMRPQDKVDAIIKIREAGGVSLMIGDGVNDAPVLSAADVSIAMLHAADISKSRADAVLLSERLMALPEMLDLGAETRKIVRQNITWAVSYNGLSIPFAMLGLVPPWAAAIGMSLSSLLVIANALRLRRSSAFGKTIRSSNGEAVARYTSLERTPKHA
ncbi:MAG: heavy metal translocating P-type ATPase [Pseudomonadales bacterium]